MTATPETPEPAADREVLGPEPVPWRIHLNPLATAAHLWRCRHLVWQFAWRDVVGRYRGSRLGIVWSFVHPLLMLAVYTFIFGFVLEVRLGVKVTESPWTFALTLFCGLVLFTLFAESVTRCPAVILTHPSFVKKTIFPLEVLPAAVTGAALILSGASFVVLLVGRLLLVGSLPVTVICLPLVVLPVVLLGVGLGWLLASVGTFLRDIAQVVTVATQVLLFVTPIFYPLEMAPPKLRPILAVNPLAVVVESGRRVLMWNQWPAWGSLAAVTVLAAVIAQLGYAWFMHTKRGFADVV